MNAVLKTRHQQFYRPNMKGPAFWSVVFHVTVFVLITLGVPFYAVKPEPEETIIAVELFDIAEFNQTTTIDEPNNVEEDQPPPKLAEPVYNNSETAPDFSTRDELLTPEPPDIDIDAVPDITEIKKPPKPKPKPKPKKKPEPKPKPLEPKIEKPPEPEVEEPDEMNSLLKSLITPDESAPTNQQTETVGKGRPSQISELATRLTSSEFAALNAGVSPCWNVDAGMIYSDDLIVTLFVQVNEDRTVRSAELRTLDQFKYKANQRFAVSTDAARRALLDPRCRTLKLPEGKYELWKEFHYTFDPSEMLR